MQHSAAVLAAAALSPDGAALLGPDCTQRLERLLKLHHDFRHVAAADVSGRLVCSTATRPGPTVNIAQDELFKRTMRTTVAATSGLVRCPVTGRRGVVVQHPIMDGQAPIGVLVATTDFASIMRLARAAGLPSGATMSVVNKEGVVFAAFPDYEPIGKEIPDAAAFGRRVAARAAEFIEPSSPGSGDPVAAYARIHGLGGQDDAFARVTFPSSGGGWRGSWLFVLALPFLLLVMWLAADTWAVGRFATLMANDRGGKLVGRYRAQRNRRDFAYEVSWSDSATGILWEAKVRVDGELVGLPSGEIARTRGVNAKRAVRREIEAAIEHRLAQD